MLKILNVRRKGVMDLDIFSMKSLLSEVGNLLKVTIKLLGDLLFLENIESLIILVIALPLSLALEFLFYLTFHTFMSNFC